MGNGRDGTSASQDTASTFQPSIALRTAFALLLSFIHHRFLPFSSKLMRTAFSAADFGSPLFNYFLSVSVLISEPISHRMWVKFFSLHGTLQLVFFLIFFAPPSPLFSPPLSYNSNFQAWSLDSNAALSIFFSNHPLQHGSPLLFLLASLWHPTIATSLFPHCHLFPCPSSLNFSWSTLVLWYKLLMSLLH